LLLQTKLDKEAIGIPNEIVGNAVFAQDPWISKLVRKNWRTRKSQSFNDVSIIEYIVVTNESVNIS